MALLDVTGGALLTRLYRNGGVGPVALGLLGFLAYRAYQKRERLTDMFGGALGGIGKLPAMMLARADLSPPKRARKTRPRRKPASKSATARPRRRAVTRKASSSHDATVH